MPQAPVSHALLSAGQITDAFVSQLRERNPDRWIDLPDAEVDILDGETAAVVLLSDGEMTPHQGQCFRIALMHMDVGDPGEDREPLVAPPVFLFGKAGLSVFPTGRFGDVFMWKQAWGFVWGVLHPDRSLRLNEDRRSSLDLLQTALHCEAIFDPFEIFSSLEAEWCLAGELAAKVGHPYGVISKLVPRRLLGSAGPGDSGVPIQEFASPGEASLGVPALPQVVPESTLSCFEKDLLELAEETKKLRERMFRSGVK